MNVYAVFRKRKKKDKDKKCHWCSRLEDDEEILIYKDAAKQADPKKTSGYLL